MAIAFDGTQVPTKLERMACGGVPWFDNDSGCAYRCDQCGAVIGSMSQPDECQTINDDADNRKKEWEMLAGEL